MKLELSDWQILELREAVVLLRELCGVTSQRRRAFDELLDRGKRNSLKRGRKILCAVLNEIKVAVDVNVADMTPKE